MKSVIAVKGMHCRSCEALIKDVLIDIKGVVNADVSLDNGKAIVHYDDKIVSIEKLKQSIAKEGYEVL